MYIPQNQPQNHRRRGSEQRPSYCGQYVAIYRGEVIAHGLEPIDADRVPEGSARFFSINDETVRQLTRR